MRLGIRRETLPDFRPAAGFPNLEMRLASNDSALVKLSPLVETQGAGAGV
jgi:hypothetical protein